MSRNTLTTLNHLMMIATALQKLPAGTVLKISGVSTPVPNVVTGVQADLGLYTDARDALTVERQKAKTRDDQDTAVKERIVSLHKALEMELGETNPQLADFGFQPKQKKRQLTPEEKAARAAKAKATRLRNGTLGSRQKRALDAKPPTPPTGGTKTP